MPSSSHRQVSSNTGKQDGGLKGLLKSRVLWAVVAVLGVFWGGVVAWSNTRISSALDEATETGPAVTTTHELLASKGDVWLPEEVSLSDPQLAALDTMGFDEQHAWLMEQGGISIGPTQVQVEVRGNRSDQVRIVDLRPVSECSPMETGWLAAISPPQGAIPTNSAMTVAVEDPNQRPTWFDITAAPSATNAGPVYYFDRQTITLNRDETEFLVINLDSEQSLCTVNLEITIIEEGEQSKQLVFAEGEEIKVAPRTSDPFLHMSRVVYLHAQMCEHFVRIPPDVFANLPWEVKCGPGNLRNMPGS